MLTRRQLQVNKLILKEVSALIEKEVELPLNTLATVTNIKLRSDLNECQIGLSILPSARSKEVFSLILAKKNFIQSVIHKKFFMRNVPKIRFYLDEQTDKGERIEELLDSLKEEE